ncbi:MAG TPA: hypothetical protein VMN35_04110 [Gaiellaceae bacterium]|nr:hypothetical protein [Gaiellaceae bacterium]
MATCPRSCAPTVARLAVGVAGVAGAGAGIWARRDVERTLAREQSTCHSTRRLPAAVRTPREARVLAELIRERTLEAGGRHVR